MPKSALRIAAEELCKKFPAETPSRTLAKKLASLHQMPIENARTAVRLARGNTGASSRKSATSPRPNQAAGWKPELPPSLARPWLPFVLGNDQRVGVISDLHIPYHSMVAVESAVKALKKHKPDVLLINGDLADFYSISRHQKDNSKRNLTREIELIKECLSWLRGQFPKARIVLKLGNHEERWQHWLWNSAPEISDHPRMTVDQWIDAEKYGVEIVGDKRPIMAGKLPIFHGHELPRGISSPVNPARGAFMRAHSTMLVAHSHVTSQHSESDLWHVPTATWSMGCLCDKNPEYAVINKWNWGFAFVDIASDGEFDVENFRIGVEGQIYR